MTEAPQQAQELSAKIIKDIITVNDTVVGYQHSINSNMPKMNEILEETKVDSAYLLSLIKASHLTVGNLLTQEMPLSEQISALVGMQISMAVLLRRQFVDVLSDDKMCEAIAAISNLLTLVELQQDEEATQDS